MVDPTGSREQHLKELAITTEGRIQAMRENRRLEEARATWEKERDERALAGRRIDAAIEGFSRAAGPLVEGLGGALANRLSGSPQPPPAPGNGVVHAPMGINGPAPPSVPDGSHMSPWTCYACGVTNWSQPGAQDDTCTNCGVQVSLTEASAPPRSTTWASSSRPEPSQSADGSGDGVTPGYARHVVIQLSAPAMIPPRRGAVAARRVNFPEVAGSIPCRRNHPGCDA